jgi:hypothetical protein
MTTQEELTIVREAIQLIIQGAAVASVNFGGMSISYHANRLDWLQQREQLLISRLSTTAKRYRSSLEIM